MPVPVPDPLDTSIQAAELAVHAQPEGASTVTLTRPPVWGTATDVVARLYRHGAGSCFSPTRASLTRMSPERGVAAALGETRTVRVPAPWPEDGLTTAQLASLLAVQPHSRAALTETLTCAPSAGTDVGTPDTVVWHFGAAGPTSCADPLPHATARSAATMADRSGRLNRYCTAGPRLGNCADFVPSVELRSYYRLTMRTP